MITIKCCGNSLGLQWVTRCYCRCYHHWLLTYNIYLERIWVRVNWDHVSTSDYSILTAVLLRCVAMLTPSGAWQPYRATSLPVVVRLRRVKLWSHLSLDASPSESPAVLTVGSSAALSQLLFCPVAMQGNVLHPFIVIPWCILTKSIPLDVL